MVQSENQWRHHGYHAYPGVDAQAASAAAVRLDSTTIPDPIFDHSPPPIDGVGVDPALFALEMGILGILVGRVVHIVMTEPQVGR